MEGVWAVIDCDGILAVEYPFVSCLVLLSVLMQMYCKIIDYKRFEIEY